jgi:lipase ATG15
LTNAALWSAAYGMQILRSFLPFGFIWNPIFDELVKAVSIIESTSIKRVSYYKETSDFVRWLQSSGIYADVKISGHSLGGGLSIITAAQTKVSGIAISGPNAMMLRKALEPPVSEEALDTYTFNVIPDRDMVPTAGGVAKAYENIQCRSAPNDPFGCHDVLRSLCEILFTCGTNNRPVMCQCVAEYGYPEPISSNGESFAEACGI